MCLSCPSAAYLLVLYLFVFSRPRGLPYQNVLYLHLSRPRDRISICLSMPATSPQDQPEMSGGDDLKSDDDDSEIEDYCLDGTSKDTPA